MDTVLFIHICLLHAYY